MAEKELQVSSNRNVLSINGRQLSFDVDIQMHIVVGDTVVVLLEYESYSDEDREQEANVFGISSDGGILWRINPHPGESFEGKVIANPYVNIVWREEESKLVTYDMDGICFDVDPKTGKTSNPIFTR